MRAEFHVNRKGKLHSLHKPEELVEMAAGILKISGFQLYTVSRISETCYYRLPGEECLLRVSTHSRKNTKSENFSEISNVVASITFAPDGINSWDLGYSRISNEAAKSRVFSAIGQYIFRCALEKIENKELD